MKPKRLIIDSLLGEFDTMVSCRAPKLVVSIGEMCNQVVWLGDMSVAALRVSGVGPSYFCHRVEGSQPYATHHRISKQPKAWCVASRIGVLSDMFNDAYGLAQAGNHEVLRSVFKLNLIGSLVRC